MLSKFKVATSKKNQLIDITDKVLQFVKKQESAETIAVVFARHTTCAVVISEVEENLDEDLIRYLETDGPKGPFNHSHGDAPHTPSHILSAAIGQSQVVPILKGELQLGTWQRICLLELDGPRNREVIVQTI